jgi:hypothetical protein
MSIRIEDTFEIDHIIPKFAGGAAFHADGTKFRKDVYKNLQLVHEYCHESKTKKDMLIYKKDIENERNKKE